MTAQFKKVRVVSGLALMTLLLLIALFFFLKLSEPEPVLTFRGGSISQNTYHFLHQTEYAHLNDDELIQKLKDREVQGALATKQGLKDNKMYHWALNLRRRSRLSRGAHLIWRNLDPAHSDENFEYDQIWKDLKFEINLDHLSEQITQYVDKNEINPRLKIDPEDLIAGRWSEGEITLAMLKKEMLSEEWERMLTFAPVPRKQELSAALKTVTDFFLYSKAIKRFRAVEEELIRQDHNHVAAIYLPARYGQSAGAFPVDPIQIEFKSTELFDHFFKIKESLKRINWVKCRYVVVNDSTTAELVYERLRNGDPFLSLAEIYAINKDYLQTAGEINQIYRVDPKYGLERDHLRPYIERVILYMAKEEIRLPKPLPLDKGYLVADLLKIEKENEELQFKDFRIMVKLDLQKELLARQFPIDLQDMRQELNFQQFEIKPIPQ
ncbi:hypothetical protein WDW89_02530 [Deltaproteobacteria bacterium TL4]